MLIFKQNKPESNILLIIFFYLVLTLNVRASDLKVAAPDAYTSLTLETIETADEFDIVKLWKGININPKSEYEFSFVHGEKMVSCRLLQKSTNFMESFPKEILDCIEVSDVGERIIDYGAFTLNESISGDDEKIFTFIYSNSYGFKFNKKEHPYLFIESTASNINSYDGSYVEPMTAEGSLYSYSGIADDIYKGDLEINDNTFTLDPNLTLFPTELTAKLGSAAEMFINNKKAEMGVGCLVGGVIGGLAGFAVDVASGGGTLALGSATLAGASMGCLGVGSVMFLSAVELDRRTTCSVYYGFDSDYVVCQEWEKEVKDRSSTFSGALTTPIIGTIRALPNPDHLEIYFPEINQKVSFLIPK